MPGRPQLSNRPSRNGPGCASPSPDHARPPRRCGVRWRGGGPFVWSAGCSPASSARLADGQSGAGRSAPPPPVGPARSQSERGATREDGTLSAARAATCARSHTVLLDRRKLAVRYRQAKAAVVCVTIARCFSVHAAGSAVTESLSSLSPSRVGLDRADWRTNRASRRSGSVSNRADWRSNSGSNRADWRSDSVSNRADRRSDSGNRRRSRQHSHGCSHMLAQQRHGLAGAYKNALPFGSPSSRNDKQTLLGKLWPVMRCPPRQHESPG